jgi:hypothetical protein
MFSKVSASIVPSPDSTFIQTQLFEGGAYALLFAGIMTQSKRWVSDHPKSNAQFFKKLCA